MIEIGSEFAYADNQIYLNEDGLDWLPYGEDNIFTFSGRTAIETVLRDCGDFNKVLLPSYCCDSMIEPFRNKGANLNFYDVNYDRSFNIDIKIPDDCEILLLCNYFGFEYNFNEEEIIKFKEKGGIIIEDVTHSLLSVKQYHEFSDYLVASLRKWGPLLDGGFCSKKKGQFLEKPDNLVSSLYIEQKTRAMKLKSLYLQNGREELKQEYLEIFSWCNHYLAKNYSNTLISDDSKKMLKKWNIEEIRKKRISNAAVLYFGLRDVSYIEPVFDESDMDCPIFVPVLVKAGKRDLVRQKLIDNSIYCPVHWPVPNDKCASDLYDMELSLICDQRYDDSDMHQIIKVLRGI